MSPPHSVVVGATSGIGLATARRLVELGHKVTITARDVQKLAAAAKALGGAVTAMAMDAADAAALPGAFTRIGALDHLVLALGSGKGGGPFATVALADVRKGFEEKVFAHFATAQAALPRLAPTGSITLIAAVSAHAAMPGTAGLGAANAAVAALVPILAAELRPLRVNGVSPGVVDTPWWDFLDETQKTAAFADYAAKTPVGRVGRPDDIAQAVAFLVSDSFMSGHTIVCDGGIRLAG